MVIIMIMIMKIILIITNINNKNTATAKSHNEKIYIYIFIYLYTYVIYIHLPTYMFLCIHTETHTHPLTYSVYANESAYNCIQRQKRRQVDRCRYVVSDDRHQLGHLWTRDDSFTCQYFHAITLANKWLDFMELLLLVNAIREFYLFHRFLFFKRN